MYRDAPTTASAETNFNNTGEEPWAQNIVNFYLQGLNGVERNNLAHNWTYVGRRVDLEGALEAIIKWCETTCTHEQHNMLYLYFVSFAFSLVPWLSCIIKKQVLALNSGEFLLYIEMAVTGQGDGIHRVEYPFSLHKSSMCMLAD